MRLRLRARRLTETAYRSARRLTETAYRSGLGDPDTFTNHGARQDKEHPPFASSREPKSGACRPTSHEVPRFAALRRTNPEGKA
jgi:hypothetical protein